MRRAAIWAGRILAGFIVVALVTFLTLMTTTGQRFALRIAEYAIASADGGVTFGTLEGSLLSEGRIDRIGVQDRDGTWLDVRNVEFSWRPLALIHGRLEILNLTVGMVDIQRTPLPASQHSTNSTSSDSSLVALTAQRLEIKEIVLREATDVPARLHVSGRADLVDLERGLSAQIKIRRLDVPGGKLEAHLSYRPDKRSLDLVAQASEPGRGLVATLLDIPGAPPLSFVFNGTGLLDAWRAQWSMAATDQPFAAGTVQIDRDGERHHLDARFEGYLQAFVPPALSSLLAGKTTGTIKGAWAGIKRFDAESVLLASDALRVTAAGGFEPDEGYAFGRLDARVTRADGQNVQIALGPDAPLSFRDLEVHLLLPETKSERRVETSLIAKDLAGDWGSLERLDVTGQGIQQHPAGESELALGRIDVRIVPQGLQPLTPGLSDVIGPTPEAQLTGSLSSTEGKIDGLRIVTSAGVVRGRGTFKRGILSASAELEAQDLSKTSALAGQPLGGQITVQSEISFTPSTGSFSVALDATGQDLAAVNPSFAKALKGTTRLSGKIDGATSGKLTINDVSLTAAGLNGRASGAIDDTKVDVNFEAQVADLSSLDNALKGQARLIAQLKGPRNGFTTNISLDGQGVTLHGQPVTSPTAKFAGQGSFAAHAGTFTIGAQIAKRALSGHSRLAFSADGATAVDDLRISFGAIQAQGNILTTASGVPIGKLSVTAPSLSDLSVIMGKPVEGGLAAHLELSENSGTPAVVLRAEADRVRYEGMQLRGFKAVGSAQNYLAALQVNAELRLQDLTTDGLNVSDVRVDAHNTENASVRVTGAGTINGGTFRLVSGLTQRDTAFDVAISEAELRKGARSLRLKTPTQISIADGATKLQKIAISAGDGLIEIAGGTGPDALALDVVLKAVPANISDAFTEDLRLEGVIDGRVAVRGSSASPVAETKLSWRNASAGPSRAQHLPPVNIDLTGRFAGQKASGVVTVRGPDRLQVNVDGSAITNDRGEVKAQITGDLPLALANGILGARATRVGGRATLAAEVGGTIAAPAIAGSLSLANVTVDDPGTGLKLTDTKGIVRFTQSKISIEKLEATSAKGGTLNANGNVVIDGSAPVDIQLALGLSGFKFDDRQLMAGEVDGALDIRGTPSALTAGGTIYIKRLDVTVPNQLPRSVSELELKHVNAPTHIQKREKARSGEGSEGEPMHVALDIRIEAANRIFVRGRGLDAQLGGDLRLQGTAARPMAVGAFAMERGRLAILGRQLDFKRGNLDFNGSVEPQLDMEASGPAGDVTVIVSVTGAASKPTFNFSSIPELPEDEVVARFLFNKELAGLSPLQLAQLASEIDKIGGLSSGPSVLDQLKSSVGIDVLDVGTDQNGGATVSAGSYVDEKTYIGVRGGTSMDSSRVVIDHDLTKSLNARGEVGADGNSKVGIGFEWDY